MTATVSGDALPEERQTEILRRLSHHGRVAASELAALLVVPCLGVGSIFA